MNPEEGRLLIGIARNAIEWWVKKGTEFKPKDYPESFNEKQGVFVSLHTKSNQLRGCIGFIEPEKPLIKGLVEVAISASQDPRFPNVSKDELDNIDIEVSILTKPEPVEINNIKKGDGIIIEKGFNRSVFLPQVWEELHDKENFLNQLCIKAGLAPDEWKHDIKAYKFNVEIFKE
ncbi:MAG: AmmeMemoRadiSam system protein A [Candidatus Aenigmarchaeota archaeon]|nr:AmmeMemoRadiSam system protein A [Candidatus Aenigmarchaeota archaeon]